MRVKEQVDGRAEPLGVVGVIGLYFRATSIWQLHPTPHPRLDPR